MYIYKIKFSASYSPFDEDNKGIFLCHDALFSSENFQHICKKEIEVIVNRFFSSSHNWIPALTMVLCEKYNFKKLEISGEFSIY